MHVISFYNKRWWLSATKKTKGDAGGHINGDARRQKLAKAVADLSIDVIDPYLILRISDYLDNRKNVDFEDKHQVVDAIVTIILTTNETVKIEWKIWRAKCPSGSGKKVMHCT